MRIKDKKSTIEVTKSYRVACHMDNCNHQEQQLITAETLVMVVVGTVNLKILGFN